MIIRLPCRKIAFSILMGWILCASAMAEHESVVQDSHPTVGSDPGTFGTQIYPTSSLTPGHDGCPSPHLHGDAFGHADPAPDPTGCGHGFGSPIFHDPEPPEMNNGVQGVQGVQDLPGTPMDVQDQLGITSDPGDANQAAGIEVDARFRVGNINDFPLDVAINQIDSQNSEFPVVIPLGDTRPDLDVSRTSQGLLDESMRLALDSNFEGGSAREARAILDSAGSGATEETGTSEAAGTGVSEGESGSTRGITTQEDGTVVFDLGGGAEDTYVLGVRREDGVIEVTEKIFENVAQRVIAEKIEPRLKTEGVASTAGSVDSPYFQLEAQGETYLFRGRRMNGGEFNYYFQGVTWAKAGVPESVMNGIIYGYKDAKYGSFPSENDLSMAHEGYEDTIGGRGLISEIVHQAGSILGEPGGYTVFKVVHTVFGLVTPAVGK